MTVVLHGATTAFQAGQSGWSKKRHMKRLFEINHLAVKHRGGAGAVPETGLLRGGNLRCAQPRSRQAL
ncbi:hypothetical protein [Pseudoxanthomonas suwonensis]|uniref:hypothetical protein n=1 Tax=Pseudoxanthomonas suwonensis TaxID=314722 RepID=UPI0012DE065B|nr:hypothetical protein [Pseudoxanthomonas suwonensis]